MVRRLFGLSCLFSFAVGVGACGTLAEDETHGTRPSAPVPYAVFRDDGTWFATAAQEVSAMKDGGTFTTDGEMLTLRSGPGYPCSSSGPGTYALTFGDADTVTLSVIEDPCTSRADDLEHGLVRYFAGRPE